MTYPGANGQFANAKMSFGKNIFSSKEEEVIKKIRTGIYRPLYDWGKNANLITI